MQSIKGNKPSKKSGFIQGFFPLNECLKYRGEGPIIYRSSWEKKFCIYCERTPDIIAWSSESISIPYISKIDGRQHKYFPDFLVKLANGDTLIIEVKPKAQLIKPKIPKTNSSKAIASYKWSFNAWLTNLSKREYAEQYAKQRGWKFVIVTEDFFKNK